jgi:transcription initiation factor TFIIE subunit alpha
MDLAQTLVRSVVRAFYLDQDLDTRHVLIVDALVIHSALRDDDLSYLMSMNLKDLHKICGRMREDRFIAQHVRPELREGQQKASNRTYYYIDYRQAIDAIKWRVYTIDKAVQGNAIPASEKKEYFCKFCKAEWTQMEVLDNMDPQKGFLCHRCAHVLTFDPERQAGGHEQSTRLNNQLRFITGLLPQLDSVPIPDNTFDRAYAVARPVVRDAQNQVAQSVAVETQAKPTAVRGEANTGPKSIAINITDSDGPSEADKEAERKKREEMAAKNALPLWHKQSTVTGVSFTADGNSGTSASSFIKGDDEDRKLDEDKLSAENAAEVDTIFAALQKQQEEQARKQAEEDEEDDEDDDEDNEEFEDIGTAPPNGVTAIGEKRLASGSGTTSAADTPASDDRPSKKVKVEEPADDVESEDEDIAFEDV